MTASLDWIVHRYDTLGSTMDTAAQLARLGARDKTIVRVDEQTAGRGRAGRRWQAPAGSGVFGTAILRPDVPPQRLSPLPLLVGAAVAETIEQLTGARAHLKWPNDVWIGEDPQRQKVGGILTTSSLQGDRVDSVLVGIGINVTSSLDGLPRGATSMIAATGVACTADEVFTVLLDRLDDAYGAFVAARGRPSLARWRRRAALLGERVSIEEAGRTHTGTFVGIDDDGALLLENSTGEMLRFVAGDLVRGPSAAELAATQPPAPDGT